MRTGTSITPKPADRALHFSLFAGNSVVPGRHILPEPSARVGAPGVARRCNELNPNVFRFRAGSGRQFALAVLGEGGASGLLGGPFES